MNNIPLNTSYSLYENTKEKSFLEIVMDNHKPKSKGISISSIIGISLFLLVLSAILTFIPMVVFKSINSNPTPSIYSQEQADVNIKKISDIEYASSLDVDAKRELTALVSYVSNEIIKKSNSSIKNPEKLAFQIVAESLIAEEDPLFVSSLILAESTFRKDVKSSVGALGLMQVMPRTGEYVAELANYKWHGVASLKNPETNLKLGIAYIKHLKKIFNNNISNVLIAYNWGPTNVKRGKKAPSMSVKYSNKIQKNTAKWQKDFNNRIHEFRFHNLDTMLS